MSQRSAVRGWVAVAAGGAAVLVGVAGCGSARTPAAGTVAVQVAAGGTGSAAPSTTPTPDAAQRLARALAALPGHGSLTLGPVTRSDGPPATAVVRIAQSTTPAVSLCSDVVAVGSLVPVRADARVTWRVGGGDPRSMRRGVRQTALAAAVATDCRSALARGQGLVITAALDTAAAGAPGTMRLEVRRGSSGAARTAVVTVTYATT